MRGKHRAGALATARQGNCCAVLEGCATIRGASTGTRTRSEDLGEG